jgi:HSP20 family protein
MNDLITRDTFEDLFRGFLARPMSFGTSLSNQAPEMRIDVQEDPEAYAIHAERPGTKKEDIHVNFENQTVSISAERKEEKSTEEKGRSFCTERYFGQVSPRFQLGQCVDSSQASAKFKDSVLGLHLPKRASSEARSLQVE